MVLLGRIELKRCSYGYVSQRELTSTVLTKNRELQYWFYE